MSAQPDDVFKHADNIVCRKVMEETMLIPISGDLATMDELYSLNETSAFIWQALDGSHSLADIGNMLEQRYDVPSDRVQADLLKIVNSLLDAGLLVNRDGG